MPIYIFQDDRDDSIHEIVMSMKEEHRAFAPDGYELKRIFVNPQASVDTKWNPDDPKDFVRKSALKKGTVGDLEDKAKELSLKREKKYGVDKVKERMYADYSKIRGGKQHPNQRRENLEKISKTPIELKIK